LVAGSLFIAAGALCCCGDLGGEFEWNDDEWLAAITFHDEQVSVGERSRPLNSRSDAIAIDKNPVLRNVEVRK
jgi:hypothetical protein